MVSCSRIASINLFSRIVPDEMYANHKTRGRRGRQKMECETRENRRYRGISRERCGKDCAYVGRLMLVLTLLAAGQAPGFGERGNQVQEKEYQRDHRGRR